MADSTAATSPATPGGAQKSPLDVLEEILNESKQAGGGAPGAPTGPSPEEIAAQEEAARQAQLAAHHAQMAEAKARDEQEIQKKLGELQQTYTTPQYQEAVRQKNEKAQEQQQHDQATDGFEIVQLQHKKIDVDPNAPN